MKVTQIGKYSVDIRIDNSVNIESEIATMKAKELQKEIDREMLRKFQIQQYKNLGWHCVIVEDYTPITDAWCKKYIKGRCHCFGHYWYFEDLRDANYFVLKWGTT